MGAMESGLAALSVFSAVMLTYNWLSLYDNVDYVVIFYAGMLVASLASLILRKC